jgi:hypothetical protein
MARRSTYQLKILGFDQLQRLAASLSPAQRRLADGISSGIAHEIAEQAPHGVTHRLEDSWKGYAIDEDTGVVESNHPAAKARDRGAYIVPKNGKAIRFRSSLGGTVFARFVRQKGTGYVDKGLRRRRVIAEAVFEQEFGDLRHKAGADG